MGKHRASVFQRVAGLQPRRNLFDLSYSVSSTCDMGTLIPVGILEAVPGDQFKISCHALIRLQPPAAPMMHDIYAHIHYFFVPYRILDDQGVAYSLTDPLAVGPRQRPVPSRWEQFIIQAMPPSGDFADLPIQLQQYPPRQMIYTSGSTPWKNGWVKDGSAQGSDDRVYDLDGHIRIFGRGSLWDYFGFATLDTQSVFDIGDNSAANFSNKTSQTYFNQMQKYGPREWQNDPLAWPWMAYNRVFNEYYRDQDLQSEVSIYNPSPLQRNWRKDYFTSARPSRGKGVLPALPVSTRLTTASLNTFRLVTIPSTTQIYTAAIPNVNTAVGLNSNMASSNAPLGLSSNSGNTVPAATFDLAILRQATQLTKWLERNMRAGTRYTEFLRSHFGVSPTDNRLDRPEYIGGIKLPVMVSELLQTSQTSQDSVLGEMGARALGASSGFVSKYNVDEYGIIISLLSVMPKPTYQDNMHRSWRRKWPTDYYFPEFAHLSEQAIMRSEVQFDYLAPGQTFNNTIFGFAGIYDELRVMSDIVTSDFRLPARTSPVRVPVEGDYGYDYMIAGLPLDDVPNSLSQASPIRLSYWNLARKWQANTNQISQDPTINTSIGRPALNSTFISCVPRKDVFLVRGTSINPIHSVMASVYHNIRALRPLPLIAEPANLDHY